MTDKRVKDLVAGDETDWYKVCNVIVSPTQVIAEVQHTDGGMSERVWDNPDHILTVKDKLFQLEWGISPNREVSIAYGARAIYRGPGTLPEIVWDRQSCAGGTPEQREAMCKWINEYGLPEIKKITQQEGLYGNEDRRVGFDLHNWFVVVNPRSSCGYLYIGIYPVDTGDPSFFPAPVPSPAPAKKPGVKKARRR